MSRKKALAATDLELPLTRAWFAEVIASKDVDERSRLAEAVVEAVRRKCRIISFILN